MTENEKGAIGTGTDEKRVNDGNVSENSRPGSNDGNKEVSVSANDVAAEIQSSRGQKNPNPTSEAEKVEIVAAHVQQALAENLVAYDAYDIQKTFPKAFVALQEYINNQAHLPVDMDSIIGILLYSGRTVTYEFFDSKKLFVNILGYDDKWYYTIERTCQSTEDYKTRIFCEVAAFRQAFAELEKQLNYNQKP